MDGTGDLWIGTRVGRLRVRVIGEGPPAVLWHGMFIDSTVWDGIIPALAERRRLMVVDGPGHGRSDPLRRRSSIAECAEIAGDLLHGLGVDGPVDWVGNAWGGHTGLAIAMSGAPALRSLVAIGSPTMAVAPPLRSKVTMLLPLLQLAGMRGPVRSAILDAQLTDASRRDPRIMRTVDAALDRPSGASMRRAVRSFILDRADVTPRLPLVRIPSLFVATDDRGEWSPEDVASAAAAVPSARTATVSGSRILAPLERPGETADAILAFWNGLDEAQANAGATSEPTVRT